VYGSIQRPNNTNMTFNNTYEFYAYHPKVKPSDFRPRGIQTCQDFNVIGSCVLSKGKKQPGDFMYGDIDMRRSSGPDGAIALNGQFKHLTPSKQYTLQLRGDGALSIPLEDMDKSPLIKTVGTFVTTEFGVKEAALTIPESSNVTLWGENSMIGRSMWVVDDGGNGVAKCVIGIDAYPNNFAHPPRKFLSIEAASALMYPPAWDALNGAKREECTPSATFKAEQATRSSVNLALTADGLVANGEYTLEIHEYGDVSKVGEVGRVFNPKLWGSQSTTIEETWLDARIQGIKADANGKISYSASKNFTLNGWESIVGRSVVLYSKGKLPQDGIAGVIGISKYDADASSDDSFFARLADKVKDAWKKLPTSAKWGGSAFVVLLLLAIIGGCTFCIMRRRQKHQEKIQGGPTAGASSGLAAQDGKEMSER